MRSNPWTRRFRRLTTVIAVSLGLALSACGQANFEERGSAAQQEGGGADASTADSGMTDSAGLQCQEPPAAPGHALSFTPDDLPPAKDGTDTPITATVETNCGDIVLELDTASAPQTVASFEFLAEQGYWDDSPCHRLTTAGIFVLQCGDPTGTGRGNPGYGYGIENAPEDGVYAPGVLAMARTADPNSNGGQFFIVYEPTMLPTQGGGYSVFGRVTQGLELVQALAEQGVRGGATDGPPDQAISILSIHLD